ncbi:Ankyrin repeat protein 2 [Giardia muris]|uniref:Ankyrin repeat protein 2 n=1 Tax=Giardia muris TaxID=5742 RepID=A0A4Z1SP95_GIAMU|nr:Ankyrin repeat protein 2 [Giardia muris]|eukprot:TNJ27654.1 Ankyrin repeat protein 2 [Giardia muris]
MSVTDLMRAAGRGDLECVKRNLSQVGRKDGNGQTALMEAAINGHANCIPLLEKEIGMQNKGGWTALMYAVTGGNADCVRLLLSEAGKKTKEWKITLDGKIFILPPGMTALMMATYQNRSEIVELLLPFELGIKDRNGNTALMWTVIQGHASYIPLLKEEIGMQNNIGWTALMCAVSGGNANCARLLLSEARKRTMMYTKVALPNRTTFIFSPGATALMIAARRNHPEIVELLLPYEQGMIDSEGHTANWYANKRSKEGDYSRVRKLLENESSKCVPPPPKESVFLRAFATVGDIEGVRKHLDHAGYQDSNGMTALMLAAEKGYTDCILLLEKEHGMQNNEGKTALMLAVRQGHANCIPLLKEEFEMRDNDGCIALMHAVREGYSKCIPLLGEEIGVQNVWGCTALMFATFKGHSDCIPLLKEEIGKRDNHGWTALMKAMWSGHAKCIPLLEKEIGKQNKWGLTALMCATRNGQADSVRLLLSEAGKQTTKEYNDFPPGTTALMMAAHYNYPKIVELLLPYEQGLKDSKGHTAKWYANNSPREGDLTQVRKLLENEGTERVPPPREECLLMASAITGDIEGVRKNLDHVGYQDPTGMTALMLAASYGHSDCIPFLEKEIGMQNNDGRTALMWAAYNGHVSCIALLEEEIGKEDNDGMTALMLAASNGMTGCAQLLLTEVGKQTTREGNGLPPGTTALMLAAHNDHPEIVELLLPYEQELKDDNGETPLMKAAEKGHISCVLILKVKTEGQNTGGQTALMKAALNGHKNCVRLLLSEAGRQSEKERNGFPSGTTALMLAARYNYPNVVKLLLPYEQGLKDSNGHTAKWYANNDSKGGNRSRVRRLLRKEGTMRLPAPQNPGDVLRLRERITELAIENESLKRGLLSIDYPQEGAGKGPLQLGQKISSLEQQLEMYKDRYDNLQKTLIQRVQEAKSTTICIVCLTNPKDTLLQPCGHLCACSNCAERIMNQTCPLCRTPIESVIKAYI